MAKGIDWKTLMRGGATGPRGDPYENQRSMFAQKPQPPKKYFSDGSMPNAKKAGNAGSARMPARAPVPIARPNTTAELAAKAYGLLAPPTEGAVQPGAGPTAATDAAGPGQRNPYTDIAREMPNLPYNEPAGGPGGGTRTGQAPTHDLVWTPETGVQPANQGPPRPPGGYPTVAQDQNYLYANELPGRGGRAPAAPPRGPLLNPPPGFGVPDYVTGGPRNPPPARVARAEEMNGPPAPGNLRNAFGVNPGAQGMPSQRLHQIPRSLYPTIASDRTGFPQYPTIAQDQQNVPVQNWPSVDQLPPASDPGDPAAQNGNWWEHAPQTAMPPFPGYATNPQTGVRTKVRASNLIDLLRGGF